MLFAGALLMLTDLPQRVTTIAPLAECRLDSGAVVPCGDTTMLFRGRRLDRSIRARTVAT